MRSASLEHPTLFDHSLSTSDLDIVDGLDDAVELEKCSNVGLHHVSRKHVECLYRTTGWMRVSNVAVLSPMWQASIEQPTDDIHAIC